MIPPVLDRAGAAVRRCSPFWPSAASTRSSRRSIAAWSTYEHWLTDVDFAQAFAISQASPGPNMLIVSVIGWKVYGFLGALVATLALCLPYIGAHLRDLARLEPLSRRAAAHRDPARPRAGHRRAGACHRLRAGAHDRRDARRVRFHRGDGGARARHAHSPALVPRRRGSAGRDGRESRPARMPELPDVVVYVEALEARIVGHRLDRHPHRQSVRAAHRAAARRRKPRDASWSTCAGWASASSSRSRTSYAVVLHLMIAGRLRWMERDAKPPGRITLAVLRVRQRCARLHRGRQQAARVDPHRARQRCIGGLRHGRPRHPVRQPARIRRAPDRRRITRSSARSPTREISAASATPIPTRSCIARGCRRSR